MKAMLVGISAMQGISKKTGKPYDGHNLHIEYDDKRVDGLAVASKFVDIGVSKCEFKLGSLLEFTYDTNFNGYSTLTDVQPVGE